MKLFAIICIIVLIFYVYVYFSNCNKQLEGLNEGTSHYCHNCNDLSFGQCMECYNCGFCASGNKGKCVSGSFMGPQSIWGDEKQKNCPRYYHNDQFWRYLNSDKANECLHKAYYTNDNSNL